MVALLTEFDGSEFDVTLTGFDAAEVDELLNAFYSKEAVQDDFDIDEEKEKIDSKGAITKTGDIWKLGEHRLMCGDSTSQEDFQKLMNGRKAQMTVTSPPYGVGKDYETKGIEPWFDTMRPVIKNVTRYSGGNLYMLPFTSLIMTCAFKRNNSIVKDIGVLLAIFAVLTGWFWTKTEMPFLMIFENAHLPISVLLLKIASLNEYALSYNVFAAIFVLFFGVTAMALGSFLAALIINKTNKKGIIS